MRRGVLRVTALLILAPLLVVGMAGLALSWLALWTAMVLTWPMRKAYQMMEATK